ncbi:MAG TPA: hypothetical protein PLP55_09265, partial [Phycicoccus elongatus]|nr:hypothetical protein [Phycicoccus elongatus]
PPAPTGAIRPLTPLPRQSLHDGHLGELLDQVQACIHTDFGIEHSTIQFESVDHAAHEHATHE